MSILVNFKNLNLGVGDKVRVIQKTKDQGKERTSYFDGQIISIKKTTSTSNITVRKIGEQGIGIEKIFPLNSPTLDEIKLIKSGLKGIKHAKIYFTRNQSKRNIDNIFSRASLRK